MKVRVCVAPAISATTWRGGWPRAVWQWRCRAISPTASQGGAVEDHTQARLLALAYMDRHAGAHAFNLGNGRGFSVCEVIATAQQISGKVVAHEMGPRRAGDPAVLVASSERARVELGRRPAYTELAPIIESAWRWHCKPCF